MSTSISGPQFGPVRTNRWPEWVIVVASVWFFFSPWILQFGYGAAVATSGAPVAGPQTGTVFGSASTAAWDAWVLSVIMFLVSLSAMGRRWPWQDWLNAALAVWVFIAPWVLGFVVLASAAWDHWIVGVIIFLCAIATVFGGRRDVPAGSA